MTAGRWRLCAISPRNSRQSGFTLLEILIAVALLGILASALYGSYFSVLRARERASEGMESRRELGATLDLMRREISSALMSRSDKRLRMVVEDRDIFGRPASAIELSTLTPPDATFRSGSGTSLVRYRLEERLKRLVLTRAERDLAYEQTTPAAYPQMERISSFLVECYDGSKWQRSWDTALNGRLPQMLKVTVQVEEDGRLADFSVIATPRMASR